MKRNILHSLLCVIAVLALFSCVGVPPIGAADITCTFQGNNPPDSVDYVLQRKPAASPDTAFADVMVSRGEAITGTDPVKYTMIDVGVPPGRWTYRVAARDLSDPSLISDWSNQAHTAVAPATPTGLIIARFDAEVHLDGTKTIFAPADNPA